VLPSALGEPLLDAGDVPDDDEVPDDEEPEGDEPEEGEPEPAV
jgi:hypothetical protein